MVGNKNIEQLVQLRPDQDAPCWAGGNIFAAGRGGVRWASVPVARGLLRKRRIWPFTIQ